MVHEGTQVVLYETFFKIGILKDPDRVPLYLVLTAVVGKDSSLLTCLSLEASCWLVKMHIFMSLWPNRIYNISMVSWLRL